MVVSLAQFCPPELLIDIFGYIAPWIPSFYDADEIKAQWDYRAVTDKGPPSKRKFSPPSATLAACASVCRNWRPAAELVLYRELLTIKCGEKEPKQPQWSVRLRTRLLCRTLHARADLAARVRTAQLGIALDCDRGTLYDSPAAFVKCLAVCHNIVHLDLTLGCIRGRLAKFSAAERAALSRLTNLRHLSLRDSLHTENGCELDYPATKRACQLLALWPTIEVLSLQFDTDEVVAWKYPALKRLRELRLGNNASELAVAVLEHAPNLETAIINFPSQDILDALPQTLQYLAIETIFDDYTYDISHLRTLQVFRVLDGEGSDGVTFAYLFQLPRTVRALEVPVKMLRYRMLETAIRRLPLLALLLVQPWRYRHYLYEQDAVLCDRLQALFPGLVIELEPNVRTAAPWHRASELTSTQDYRSRWNHVPRMRPTAAVH